MSDEIVPLSDKEVEEFEASFNEADYEPISPERDKRQRAFLSELILLDRNSPDYDKQASALKEKYKKLNRRQIQ